MSDTQSELDDTIFSDFEDLYDKEFEEESEEEESKGPRGEEENRCLKKSIRQKIPWIEKYRPRTLDEIIINEHTKKKVDTFIEQKNIPNMIITGVPGIGKTSTLKCIANQLYGKYVNEAVLELNASDERGIKTVDELIMNFCKNKLATKCGMKYKMIILDEADNMTEKAQYAINKKMEEYSATTRFAFTCNTSSDIIESIQSRCTIMRYVNLPVSQMVERMTYVCKKEELEYTKEALQEIGSISNGDMRNALNILQSMNNCGVKIYTNNIYLVCDKPQPTIINNIINLCEKKDIKNAFKKINELIESGYMESDIVTGIMNNVQHKENMKEDKKIFILRQSAHTAYVMSRSMSSKLHVYALIVKIIEGYKKNNFDL
jgi:replication factor C subunit 2/4